MMACCLFSLLERSLTGRTGGLEEAGFELAGLEEAGTEATELCLVGALLPMLNCSGG